MKKYFLSFAAVIVAAITLISCSSNTPKNVAHKFLTSFYQMDFEAAKKVSTEDTKKMLEMFQQLTPMMADSTKQQLKKIKVDIKDVKNEGADKATVTYITTDNPKEQTLHLVKQNGKWLAQFSKQDQMTNDAPPPSDQPMSDTTLPTTEAIPVDTTTAAAPVQ